MEPPSFEEMNEWFTEEEFPNVQFTEDAYNYLMENMDADPLEEPDLFQEQFDGFLDMIGADADTGMAIMEGMMEMMEGGMNDYIPDFDEMNAWFIDSFPNVQFT